MNDELPDHDTMRAAVALASRAPSLFNVQPWQWQIGDKSLHLVFDRTRALPVTDPANRELTNSCGAGLHHAVLAPQLLHELVQAGEQAGAQVLVTEGGHRYALVRAFAKAVALHGAMEEYRDELAAWTGRSATAPEGVPQVAAPQPGTQYGDLVLRDFGRVAIAHEEAGSPRTVGSLLLVSTSADDRVSHLRAGEATSAILCTAELEGLASSPLSEAFEIDQTRSAVRREVLADAGLPQLALRIGWPAVSRKPPPTYRRAVQELLRGLLDNQHAH